MSTTPGPKVRTRLGVVSGVTRASGSAAFLGIPYAAPPVGERRFAAPQPARAWDGVRDATVYGPTPQRRPLAPVTTIPEPSIPGDETLSLNVFTPAPGDHGRRLPVLVWIHGGGFIAGSPASPWYDGHAFSRDGVVTVVISYRLGIDGFGWMADSPSNRGLLDQIAALEWVQANVAAFGGDPTAVTIAGQSAGGASVMALLTCGRAQHLFSSVICQSGSLATVDATAAERLSRELAKVAGIEPTRAGWQSLSEDRVLEVQSRVAAPPSAGPIDAVGLARGVMDPESVGVPFRPIVDGHLITATVEDSLTAGVGADKSLLVGATAHEFTAAFSHAREQLAELDVEAALREAGFPDTAARSFVASHAELSEGTQLVGQLMTERLFRLPLLRWVEARARGGAGDRTWLYDFRWPSRTNRLASHCNELPFVWDLLAAPGVTRVLGEDAPQRLADVMHLDWVTFVRDGRVRWSPASTGRGMVFDALSREAELFGVERGLHDAIGAHRSAFSSQETVA